MRCSVALGALLAIGVPAGAATVLHGTILAVEASNGQAVVNTAPAAGRPAMTMSYRIAPTGVIATLHYGDRIVATLDKATSPNTLRDVRVVASTARVRGAATVRHVHVLRVGDKVPQTPLVDQAGLPFTFAKYQGDDVVLAFIYTRCRDPRECPLISAKFAELQARLAGRHAHLVEVTLDPAFDTPAVLARYAKLYSADPTRWTLATGKVNNVLNFAAAFGLDPFYDPTVGFVHGETLATIDSTGTIHDLVYTNSWQPSEIIASLNNIDHLASNPFARLDLWLSKEAVAICGNGLGGFDGLADLGIMTALILGFGWLFWRLWHVLGMNTK